MIYFNAILYCSLLIYTLKRSPLVSISVMLTSLYAIGSICSVLFYTHSYFPYTIHNCVVTFEPFLYLFTSLLIFFFPILNFKQNELTSIKPPPKLKFKVFLIFLIIVNIVRLIYALPHALSMLTAGADLAGNKDAIMGGENLITVPFPLNILFIFSMIFSRLMVVFYFYYLAFYKSTRLKILLLTSITFLPEIVNAISDSSRSILFSFVTNVVFCYILFRPFLKKEYKKVFAILFSSFFALILLVVIAVTLARFQNKVGVDISYWQYKYFGESFVNFNGLLYGKLKGLTWGERNFSFFTNILGSTDINNIMELRENADAITGIPNFIFYLFIGSLYIDFGPVLLLIIAILAAIIFNKIFKINNGGIPFASLILLQFYFRMCFDGLFFFPYTLQTGNLQIIFYLLTYLLFKYKIKV